MKTQFITFLIRNERLYSFYCNLKQLDFILNLFKSVKIVKTIGHLKSRDFNVKKVNESFEQHKFSTTRGLRYYDSRILNNERYIYQNECKIEGLDFKINNLE